MPFTVINHAGRATSTPGWPEVGTLEGILAALSRWSLEKRLDVSDSKQLQPHPLRAPYRAPCLSYAGTRWSVEHDCEVFLSRDPVYPDSPDAVAFTGNFEGYSWGFSVHTDDPVVIGLLDAAIKANIERRDALAPNPPAGA